MNLNSVIHSVLFQYQDNSTIFLRFRNKKNQCHWTRFPGLRLPAQRRTTSPWSFHRKSNNYGARLSGKSDPIRGSSRSHFSKHKKLSADKSDSESRVLARRLTDDGADAWEDAVQTMVPSYTASGAALSEEFSPVTSCLFLDILCSFFAINGKL